MKVLGQILFILLSLGSVLGTLKADFDAIHIFNRKWPSHARFHAAAYAVLNIGCGLTCLWLSVFHPFGWQPSFQIATILLAVMGITLLVASAIPGTSAMARPDEPVWHGQVLTIWFALGFLVLMATGGFFVLFS